jgi:hypothetical protein
MKIMINVDEEEEHRSLDLDNNKTLRVLRSKSLN